MNILDSKIYKCKQNIYWPQIQKINKQSKNPFKDSIKAVYETERINHISRFTEWAPQQYLEALQLICNISIYCLQNNIFLKSHIKSVTLKNGKPIYIGINDLDNKPADIKQFNLNHGLEIQPRNIFFENWQYIRSEISQTVNSNISIINKFQKIKQILNCVKLADRRSDWLDYIDLRGGIPTDLSLLRKLNGLKYTVMYDIIMEKKPKTLMDLGCNYGPFSFLAASIGAKVVGVDQNSMVIERANRLAIKQNANCTFLHYDIMKPPKNYGIDEPPNIRLKSEGVLVAAVIHHLYWQGYTIENIIKVLTSYATKWFLIEIIPADDHFTKHGNKHFNWTKKWFTIENIQTLLKQQGWKNFKTMDSILPRKWLLCEK